MRQTLENQAALGLKIGEYYKVFSVSEWLATQHDRDKVSMKELHRRHDLYLKDNRNEVKT